MREKTTKENFIIEFILLDNVYFQYYQANERIM
jgi:hypothetical protein